MTAYTGAWLGIIGAGLLFFMRGFDVWLEAFKTTKAAGPALSQVFTLGPWLEVSWFLIVPLALNALVLCPIIIKRAIVARQNDDTGRYTGITSFSIYIGIVLMLASLAYLSLVIWHNR